MANIKNLNNDSVRFEDGSASSPSISFIGDTNTGIYRVSGDSGRFYFTADGTAAVRIDGNGLALLNKTLYIQSGKKVNFDYGVSNNYYIIKNSTTLNMHSPVNLSLQTNSNHRLYINQSGNVGIGTTIPEHKLTVYTDATSGVELVGQDGGNQNSDSSKIIFNGYAQDNGPFIQAINTSAYGIKRLGFFVNRTASDYTTLPTESISITNTGNVGIGTTSPGGKLSVFAANGNEDSLRLGRADTGNVWRFNHAGADLRMYNTSSSGSDIIFGTDAGGNAQSNRVSIGTASPQSPLTVKSNSTSAANSGFTLIANGSTDIIAAIGEKSTNGGRFHLYDAGVEKVAFYSDGSNNHISAGNVGIGTTNPHRLLDVRNESGVGEQVIAGTTGATLYFRPNTSYSSGGNFGIFTTGLTSGTYESTMTIKGYSSGITNVMTIKGSGNVGIGTTSPSQKLHVAGSVNIEDNLNFGIGGFLGTSTSVFTMYSLGDLIYNADSNNNGSSNHIFQESGNELMRINSSGNVGIGTTSPNEKLEVSGSVRIGDLKIQNANGGRIGLNRNTSTGAIYNSSYGAFQIQNNGSDIFEIQSYTSGGTYSGVISMKAADGNVGIGTASPSFTLGSGLEIEKSGTSTLRLQSSGSHASEINQSTSSLTIADLSSGLMIFKTGNVESMRINSSGDVGIGTTSPGRKLHISDDNDAPLRVESTDPTTGIEFKDNNDSSQLYYVGSSDHFYIPSGTSLGIGASSPTLNSMLRVYSNQTTADESVYGSFFDFNTAGSDALTANRTQAAIYVDADSSATGGGTASGTEHRLYGIYADARASGDSDFIGGITARAEANAASGQVSNTRGGEFIAVSDGSDSAAIHNNVIGTFSSAYAEDAATINSLIGSSSIAYVNSNRTTDITTLTGHSSEVEINADNTYGTAYLYRGTLDINSTHTITDTYAFRYDISGTSVATNNWGIYIDDVDKNYVSGKLGIGTGSPGENLTISGKVLSYGGTGTVGAGTSYFLGNSNNSRDIALTRVDSGALGIGRYNSGWLETMRFTIGGDVGIGTTSPAATLDVSGGSLKVQSGDTFGYDNHAAAIYMDASGRGLSGKFATNGYSRNLIRSDGSATIQIGDNTSLISLIKVQAGSSGVNGVVSFLTKNAERMRVHHDGNVGIGTTSPVSELEISNTTGPVITLTHDGTNPSAGVNLAAIQCRVDYNGTHQNWGKILFRTNNSNVRTDLDFIVKSTSGSEELGLRVSGQPSTVPDTYVYGKLGIGTTTPGAKLDVSASSGIAFRVTPNNASKQWYIDTTNADHLKKEENLVLSADPGNVHTNTVIGFRIDNSTKMQIKHDGKVGIGTTSAAYLLDVSGTIRATGDVIAYSDARVKENVETIPNALDKVKGMRGVGYNKIGEEKRSVGVIAQELLEVLPEAVHQDDQGMYSVAYGNIVGVLVEAIKEQQQQIEELKAIIDGITE